MSPRRHGSQTSVPSGSRRATGQPSRERGADRRGDVGRLALAQRRRRAAPSLVRVGAEQHDGGRPVAASRHGHERARTRVATRGSATISSRNTWLTNSITGRAVRKLRVRWRGAAPNAERAREERGDVGAAEAVDRLLRVADDEQAPGIDRRARPTAGRAASRIARREQRGEVALDRVGVLELVEQQARVARAEAAPDVPAVLGVAQHRAREHEEVVELELARCAPALVGLAQRELRDLPGQPAHRRPR